MKNNKLITILEDIGLSENEAQVYFSALSLGPTTALSLSRATDIKRTTVYSTIESLKQRGLMRIEMTGFKKKYVAESPERVEEVLEQRKERFKSSLSEFLALYNLKGGESFIKYYEGLEAIKNVYEGFLQEAKPHEDYLVLGGQEQWFNLDPDYFQKFKERRAKLNLKTRLLFTDSPTAQEHKKYEQNFNEAIKILPATTSLNTNLVITPRKVVIHQLTPPVVAVVIENQSIIQMQREMFEIIWNSV